MPQREDFAQEGAHSYQRIGNDSGCKSAGFGSVRSGRKKSWVGVLLLAAALMASMHLSFEYGAGPDHTAHRNLQAAVGAKKGAGILGTIAAALSIPRLFGRKKGPKKKPLNMQMNAPASGTTPAAFGAGGTSPEMSARIGKLVTMSFPERPDGFICRLLKIHQVQGQCFATVNIENGKHGTTVAENMVKEQVMRMAASQVMRALAMEKQKRGEGGGQPQITVQEYIAIQRHALQAAKLAISNGTAEGVAHMVGANASVVTIQGEALKYPPLKNLEFESAIIHGDLDKVKKMIKEEGFSGTYKDADDRNTLYLAAREGHEEIVDYLVSEGAKPNEEAQNGATPMFCAAQNGYTGIVKTLLKIGADIVKDRNITYLFMACQSGHIDTANVLLDAGMDPTKLSMNGFSNLYIAAQNGHEEIVKRLLEIPEVKKTVNVGMKPRRLATPALIAAQMGQFEILKMLVDAGADTNAGMTEGTTPLKVACANGDPEIIEYLIDKGADPNGGNTGGYTPLMAAAIKGNVRAAEMLIKKGAKVTLTTKQGDTALSLAKASQKHEVQQILEKLLKKGHE